MVTYTNISGTTEVNIIPISTGNGNISTLTISNTHTHKFTAAVYVKSVSTTFYLIKTVTIEPGSTLVLDGSYIAFNARKYSLWVKLEAAASGTSTATVIYKLNKR